MTPNTGGNSRLAYQVKSQELILYLKNKHWSEKTTDSPNVLNFISPRPVRMDGPNINIFIPKSDEVNGARDLIDFALRSLSSFENRNVFDIVEEILNFADCFKTRILGAKKGLLPLDLGVLLYKGSFNLIKFGAIFEYNSLRKKHTERPELALQCARSSLMGPGGHGSYIAYVYVPLKRPSADFPWDDTDPFQRKVVLRILRGLASLRDAENCENAEPIISNYDKGLNINMCNAIKDIADAGMGYKVIINAILEQTYKSPSDISTKFVLSPASKKYLDDAIIAFRDDAQKSVEEKEVVGIPEILSRPGKVERGTIKLKWYYSDIGKTINVSMDLDKDAYQQAIAAHRDKRQILVVGDLERIKKQWHLNNPRGFRMIDEDARPEKSLDRF